MMKSDSESQETSSVSKKTKPMNRNDDGLSASSSEEEDEDSFEICFEDEPGTMPNNTTVSSSDDSSDSLTDSESSQTCCSLDTSDSSDIEIYANKKKVRFNLVPQVKILYVWSFAYKNARKCYWEQVARDRVRFNNRILQFERMFSPCLERKLKKGNLI